MRLSILGKRYLLKRSYLRGRNDGYCDPPSQSRKRIIVDKRLTGEKELEIILHECLHAALWFVCESVVERLARDLARILWRLGYRSE